MNIWYTCPDQTWMFLIVCLSHWNSSYCSRCHWISLTSRSSSSCMNSTENVSCFVGNSLLCLLLFYTVLHRGLSSVPCCFQLILNYLWFVIVNTDSTQFNFFPPSDLKLLQFSFLGLYFPSHWELLFIQYKIKANVTDGFTIDTTTYFIWLSFKMRKNYTEMSCVIDINVLLIV